MGVRARGEANWGERGEPTSQGTGGTTVAARGLAGGKRQGNKSAIRSCGWHIKLAAA